MRVLNVRSCGRSALEIRSNIHCHDAHVVRTNYMASNKRHNIATRAAVTEIGTPSSSQSTYLDPNQQKREGSYELPLVQLQASKTDPEQPSLASILQPPDISSTSDTLIVGCGPAGLALAASLAKLNVNVTLVGPDVPFVNNYGVWLDEFKSLGLEHTLDIVWNDAICYFKEGKEVRVGRAYGRASRQLLRKELLEKCQQYGVKFIPGHVEKIETPATTTSTTTQDGAAITQSEQSWPSTKVTLKNGTILNTKIITLASGAAAGRFLKYEESAPSVAAQTAYGIEAEVEDYSEVYDPTSMLFMDYRRHHSGLYPGTASQQKEGKHPNGGKGLWGTENEVPSFLYAMPLGGNRVFLEETCLVAKPALPFSVLKRRLERRCSALGIKIKNIHEEEWSYIPTGGPLPIDNQQITAFGAAANLVHPATGYSIARSLREAPFMAESIASSLKEHSSLRDASKSIWQSLWTAEKRRQASFHVFGMELLCQLDVANTTDFFTTFFSLPTMYWQGFLASTLSSTDLLVFAMLTFVLAPVNIKAKLVGHLLQDPAGKYLIEVYLGKRAGGEVVSNDGMENAVGVMVVLMMLMNKENAFEQTCL